MPGSYAAARRQPVASVAADGGDRRHPRTGSIPAGDDVRGGEVVARAEQGRCSGSADARSRDRYRAPVTLARDYSLVGPENQRAVERGLAGAEWFEAPIARERLRELMVRTNGRAAIDTVLWLALLAGSGAAAALTWGSWWSVPALFVYGTLYGSASDSRWHECGHATAFRSRWPNTVVYHLASLMDMREPVSWRWSHVRHHDDTIIVGRDKEIAVKRPTPLWRIGLDLVGVLSVLAELRKLGYNLLGRLDPEDGDFVPDAERRRAIRSGRSMAVLLLVPVVAAIAIGSVAPLLFVGVLPSMYGRWLLVVYGLTQHAGLGEDVLDHRLNTRTVRMNVLNRFLYLNMNYHIEHHMFPAVPYHRLPDLHEEVKDDLPPVHDGIISAYREIIPALRRQAKDPTYFIERTVPRSPRERTTSLRPSEASVAGTWVDVCALDDVAPGEIVRHDRGDQTYAIYRTADSQMFATDGACTHGRVHLSKGHLEGTVIECAKHNGRFDITNGRALGAPALVDLGCHEVKVCDGRVHLRVAEVHPGGTP